MDNKQKIKFAEQVISVIKESLTAEEIPVLYGTLTKAYAVQGFNKADIGHPVFDYKGKYILYIERSDGKVTVEVPFNKTTLEPFIDKSQTSI